MDFQLITTYIIIAAAVAYTIYQILQLLKPSESACGGGCSSCDIKQELKKRGLNKLNLDKDKLTYIKPIERN